MLRLICVAVLLFVAAPAFAKGKHHQRGVHSTSVTTKHIQAKRHVKKRVHRTKYARVSGPRQHLRGDPRPRAWCGWWLRQQMGVADRSYNLARKWAQIGTPADGHAACLLAVWSQHVGIVTGV